MAPRRPTSSQKAKPAKATFSKASSATLPKPSANNPNPITKPGSLATTVKSKSKDSKFKSKKPTGPTALFKKKKPRVYTDKELDLPTLNSIIPAGVVAPKGKKKGKVFVEDRETMLSILSLVNDSKDTTIKSKLERNRQLEIIREARLKEQQAKEDQRSGKLEDAKDSMRRKRKRLSKDKTPGKSVPEKSETTKKGGDRKRVKFA